MSKSKHTGNKREQSGVVISNKMAKTLVVSVEKKFRDPKYGKVLKTNKKYYVHDVASAKRTIGEKVNIIETRPISKLKRWRVIEKA